MDIPCNYCGGRHASASEVRACWQRNGDSARPNQPDNAGDQQASPAPGRSQQADSRTPEPAPPTGAGRMEPVLGRSVLVRPGQPTPPRWQDSTRITADADYLAELEEAWRSRRPLVIEVDGEFPTAEHESETETADPWRLTPDFAFDNERLAHAVFANAIDWRGEQPRWWLADEAIRLGATAGGEGDVVLPDGRPILCDGGPIEWRSDADGVAIVSRQSILAGALEPFARSNASAAELAPDQLAAVVHGGGAARIIAPAGSGKTRVLTERARHLLRTWAVPGRAVTLVAFNKRAAGEMTDRTTDLPELQVRTLNALGLSIVTRSSRSSTIDEREVRDILGELVDLPRRANTDPAAAWIEALSAVRLGLQDPADVEAEFEGDVDGLAEVLVRYREVLAR
ncbi:MAG: UvrD-helicase domain-containing protein, partial [Acidimicrobiales bacterium]